MHYASYIESNMHIIVYIFLAYSVIFYIDAMLNIIIIITDLIREDDNAPRGPNPILLHEDHHLYCKKIYSIIIDTNDNTLIFILIIFEKIAISD